jgi:hypothetical protein
MRRLTRFVANYCANKGTQHKPIFFSIGAYTSRSISQETASLHYSKPKQPDSPRIIALMDILQHRPEVTTVRYGLEESTGKHVLRVGLVEKDLDLTMFPVCSEVEDGVIIRYVQEGTLQTHPKIIPLTELAATRVKYGQLEFNALNAVRIFTSYRGVVACCLNMLLID